MAVPLTNADTSFAVQALGVVAIGAFVAVASTIVWLILKASTGLRVSQDDEVAGLDQVELGMAAYPEFSRESVPV
jgi:Amt family ammonium transporter